MKAKRDTFIMLSTQRLIPPFFVTHMRLARSLYEQVYYITSELTLSNNSRELEECEIEVIQIPTKYDILQGILSLPRVMLYGGFSSLVKSVQSDRFGWKLLKNLITFQVRSQNLIKTAAEIIDAHGEDNCVVMSAWFDADSLAVARLKRRYPNIAAFSFAHSGEISNLKNPFFDLLYNDFRHYWLDGIFFISYRMRNYYLNSYSGKTVIPSKKSSVFYLGTLEKSHTLAKRSTMGEFNIVSCSSIINEKRVEMIAESVIEFSKSYGPVRWVHFGDGPNMTKVRLILSSAESSQLRVTLKGMTPNEEILTHYANESCDLFINLSKDEGIAVSMMEALSYGIPIVATNVGGSSEIARSGITGQLVSANPTLEEVVDAMMSIARLPEANRANLSRSCFEFWDGRFNANKSIPCLHRFLRSYDGHAELPLFAPVEIECS